MTPQPQAPRPSRPPCAAWILFSVEAFHLKLKHVFEFVKAADLGSLPHRTLIPRLTQSLNVVEIGALMPEECKKQLYDDQHNYRKFQCLALCRSYAVVKSVVEFI